MANASAQTDAEAIAARIGSACPSMLAGLFAEQSLEKATRQRPVTVSTVCACTAKRLQEDEKFNAYLKSPNRNPQSESRNEALQSYLAILATSSVYACLLPELEASKNAIDLAR